MNKIQIHINKYKYISIYIQSSVSFFFLQTYIYICIKSFPVILSNL